MEMAPSLLMQEEQRSMAAPRRSISRSAATTEVASLQLSMSMVCADESADDQGDRRPVRSSMVALACASQMLRVRMSPLAIESAQLLRSEARVSVRECSILRGLSMADILRLSGRRRVASLPCAANCIAWCTSDACPHPSTCSPSHLAEHRLPPSKQNLPSTTPYRL